MRFFEYSHLKIFNFSGNSSLQGVEGVRDLSSELVQKKQQLYVKLLEELRHHLYIRTSQEALLLRRQGSGREANQVFTSPFQRTSELRLSNRQRSARRNLFEISQLKPEESKYLDVEEDIDELNPDEYSSHFMAILVKCLALLEKLPVVVETIKAEMQTELLSIIHRYYYTFLFNRIVPRFFFHSIKGLSRPIKI